MKNLKILLTEEQLQTRILELANEIMKDYSQKELIFICILKGSVYFTVDLSKRIRNPLKLEFMQVSSYGNAHTSSGNIQIKLDLKESIQGKDVIIIEDIIDTGRTLHYLKNYLQEKLPHSLKICTLLDKSERREFDVHADYVGFKIPDHFVVGYGLDNQDFERNLPYIGYYDV